MKRLYSNLGAPLPGHPRSADSIVKASGKKTKHAPAQCRKFKRGAGRSLLKST